MGGGEGAAQPREDGGEELSGEGTRVQTKIPEVIESVKTVLTRLFDLTATIDVTNQDAKAAVFVDDRPPEELPEPLPDPA